jgi:hypothetical protein
MFPSGIGYDKQYEVVRTLKTNSLFAIMPMVQKEIRKTKNGKLIQMNQFSVRVTMLGFKPRTS